MRKRIIGLVLALIAAMMCFVMAASATEEPIASGDCGENLTWALTEEGVLTISGTGAMHDYDLDYPGWYDYPFTTVIIEAGVTEIGDYAFDHSRSLTSVSIADTVEMIGQRAFSYSELLTAVVIPASVRKVDMDSFYYCTALADVQILGENVLVDTNAFYNTPFLNNLTDEQGFAIYNGILLKYSGPGGEVVIPDTVQIIGGGAFNECVDMTAVTIPDTVTYIEDYAFFYCTGLMSLTIPDSVTVIGESAFGCNHSLTSLTLSRNLTRIDGSAFEFCDVLTEVTIPASVTEIGASAFGGCYGMEAFHVEDGNPSYRSENGALFTADMTSLLVVPGAYRGAFTVPAGVREIGQRAFFACQYITSVDLPASVVSIGEYAFDWCYSMAEITLRPGLTSIGNSAFSNCYRLERIEIPATVTAVGDHAFDSSPVLAEIRFAGDAPAFGVEPFYEIVARICYPEGNDSWTDVITQELGGDLIWEAYTPDPVIPGDTDGSGEVNSDDAVYLLYHVLFGAEQYPVSCVCDFDGDGQVTTDDAVYLLYHALFGDTMYPLN